MKPCATAAQKRDERFLLRVYLEAIEISLHKTCLTFTQRKVESDIISLRKWVKLMYHSKQYIYENRLCLWEPVINDSKGKNKVECTLGNNIEMLQEPCETVTQEERNASPEIVCEK